MDGRLTEDWRTEHGAEVEPAAVLLERILAERRRRWEAEQEEKYRKAGKTPLDWRAHYQKLSPPGEEEPSDLADLPDDWCWATLDQLVARSEYGTSVKCDYAAPGPPVLRIPDIARSELDLADLKCARELLTVSADVALQPGDLLVCRTNGSRGVIGKAALVRERLDGLITFASYLLRFRPVEQDALPEWLHCYLLSASGRQFI